MLENLENMIQWFFWIMAGLVVVSLAVFFVLVAFIAIAFRLHWWFQDNGWIREKRKTHVPLPVLQQCPRCHQFAIRSLGGGIWDGEDADGNHAFGGSEYVKCGACDLRLERYSTSVPKTGYSDDGSWEEMTSDDPRWDYIDDSPRKDRSKPIRVK